MESEYTKWLSSLPNMEKYSESKFQPYIHLEDLVLDLQVVQADLFGLQGSLSVIGKRLQELEVWVSEQQYRTLKQEST